MLEYFERRLLRILAELAPSRQEEKHPGQPPASLVVVRWEEAFKPNLADCCMSPLLPPLPSTRKDQQTHQKDPSVMQAGSNEAHFEAGAVGTIIQFWRRPMHMY